MKEGAPTSITRGVEIRAQKISREIERAERAYASLTALYEEIERRLHSNESGVHPDYELLESEMLETDRLLEELNALVGELQNRLSDLRMQWLDRELGEDEHRNEVPRDIMGQAEN